MLLARGLSNADVGRELVLGASTVKKHVANVLSKLDLRSRARAVVFAYAHGLARPGGCGVSVPARPARGNSFPCLWPADVGSARAVRA